MSPSILPALNSAITVVFVISQVVTNDFLINQLIIRSIKCQKTGEYALLQYPKSCSCLFK